MATYKKRGQAGWTGRKEAKSKNYIERNFAKQDIKQALEEIEAGEDYRYLHKAKKANDPETRLKKNIAWYERVLADYKMRDFVGFMGNGWLESGLKKAKAKWQEKFGDK